MTSGTSPALAHMFRRAALPLASYYAVTLGLPLANGAAQSGAAFVNHALFVVAVPPLLIVLVCTIHESVQAFARWCRSALPVARVFRPGGGPVTNTVLTGSPPGRG